MLDLTDKKVLEIEEAANTMREDIIQMLLAAGSGHSAGSLDMADVFAAFYFHILNHDPKNPSGLTAIASSFRPAIFVRFAMRPWRAPDISRLKNLKLCANSVRVCKVIRNACIFRP